MGDHYLFAGASGCGPDGLREQRRRRKPSHAVKNRILGAGLARHSIAANAGNARWRAGHQRGKAGRRLRGKSGSHIIGKSTAGNELCQIGQLSLPSQFIDKGWNRAVPCEHDRFRGLAVSRAGNGSGEDGTR